MQHTVSALLPLGMWVIWVPCLVGSQTQQWKQSLWLLWNRPAFGRGICQSLPGANSQAGSRHREEVPLQDPEGLFQVESALILSGWHRAHCLALRGLFPLKPPVNAKVKFLALFLPLGICTSDDPFRASFGTKSWCYKSTFKVDVCIFMAQSPQTCICSPGCWLNCVLIFTLWPTPIRPISR